MGFKTNRKTGNVFNDNKQRSDKHHGSVKPESGIRMHPQQKYEDTPYVKDFRLDYTHMLHGINEKINENNLELVVKNNIKFVLKEDNNWKDGYKIIIPENSNRYFQKSKKGEDGAVILSYEVLNKTNKIVHFGTVEGWIKGDKLDKLQVSYYNHPTLNLKNHFKKDNRLDDHYELVTTSGIYYEGGNKEVPLSQMRAIKSNKDVSEAILFKNGKQIDSFKK